jgi:hypothetical protein
LLIATVATAFTIPNEWVESGRGSRLPKFILPKERPKHKEQSNKL